MRTVRKRARVAGLVCALSGWAVVAHGDTLYVSVGSRVEQVTGDGTAHPVTSFPGTFNGMAFDAPDGTVSLFAGGVLRTSMPIGLAFDSQGDLYAACFATRNIKRITPAGAVSTFATLDGPPRYLVAVPEPATGFAVAAVAALVVRPRGRS